MCAPFSLHPSLAKSACAVDIALCKNHEVVHYGGGLFIVYSPDEVVCCCCFFGGFCYCFYLTFCRWDLPTYYSNAAQSFQQMI